MVDTLIRQVIEGTSPSSIISGLSSGGMIMREEESPDWKPGDKVPKGYHVTFGKLTKERDLGDDGSIDGGKAFKKNYKALKKNDPSEFAHRASGFAYAGTYSRDPNSEAGGWNKDMVGRDHDNAADAHARAADHHRAKGNTDLADQHSKEAALHNAIAHITRSEHEHWHKSGMSADAIMKQAKQSG